MDSNPIYVLVAAAFVFGVLLIIYILRRPEPARLEFETAQEAEARAEAARPKPAAPAPQLTVIQKLIAFPYFGGWLGLLLGVFLPFYIALLCVPAPLEDTPHEQWLVFAFIGFWNLAFTRLAKVRLTTPLLPVPLAAIAFLLAFVSVLGVWWG
jgi:hypothetical protein